MQLDTPVHAMGVAQASTGAIASTLEPVAAACSDHLVPPSARTPPRPKAMRRENSGIDLLSIVASERNEELAAKAALKDSLAQKSKGQGHNQGQQEMEA
jgi:hypothetical protein